MKDYYYILGLKQTATTEEIRKAYRKLSLKFHPDKNEGDEFFTERFKEIQEAYETLSDNVQRKKYDDLKTTNNSYKQNNNGANFNPEIEFFKANKQSFEYDEELTFSWKTINANKVILKPFGIVEPIGQRTYKIKDFKSTSLTFELIAENTNINRQIKSTLTLSNKTYRDLYEYFKGVISNETESRTNKKESKNNETTSNTGFAENNSIGLSNFQIMMFVAIGLISVIFLILFYKN